MGFLDSRDQLSLGSREEGQRGAGCRGGVQGTPDLPPPTAPPRPTPSCPAFGTRAPPSARRPRPGGPAPSRDAARLCSLPSRGRGASRLRGTSPPRTVTSAWRGRSLSQPGWGRSRRRCREAEPPLFWSLEPGNTRDTRRRRSGTALACCRPAASRRGDALGRARGAHPGRERRLGEPGGAAGAGRDRPPNHCPLTALTSNFPKSGSDAAHPALVGACRRALCKGFGAALHRGTNRKNAP